MYTFTMYPGIKERLNVYVNLCMHVDEVKKALSDYPDQNIAHSITHGFEFKLNYSGSRLPFNMHSRDMFWKIYDIANRKNIYHVPWDKRKIKCLCKFVHAHCPVEPYIFNLQFVMDGSHYIVCICENI
jgi:hypothetical protein